VFWFQRQNRTGNEHVWSFCGTDALSKPGELQVLWAHPFSPTISGGYNILAGNCVLHLLQTAEDFFLIVD